MFLATLFLVSALARTDVPLSSAEGALTSCSDELSPMGRSISGTPCVDMRRNRPVVVPPAPASSMQKPGGWMPSDTPGSSP